jgi:hypothetical protein
MIEKDDAAHFGPSWVELAPVDEQLEALLQVYELYCLKVRQAGSQRQIHRHFSTSREVAQIMGPLIDQFAREAPTGAPPPVSNEDEAIAEGSGIEILKAAVLDWDRHDADGLPVRVEDIDWSLFDGSYPGFLAWVVSLLMRPSLAHGEDPISVLAEAIAAQLAAAGKDFSGVESIRLTAGPPPPESHPRPVASKRPGRRRREDDPQIQQRWKRGEDLRRQNPGMTVPQVARRLFVSVSTYKRDRHAFSRQQGLIKAP